MSQRLAQPEHPHTLKPRGRTTCQCHHEIYGQAPQALPNAAWTDRRTDGQTGRRTGGQYRWTGGQTDRQTERRGVRQRKAMTR
eukprot:1203118-Rhodomonas_salina.1